MPPSDTENAFLRDRILDLERALAETSAKPANAAAEPAPEPEPEPAEIDYVAELARLKADAQSAAKAEVERLKAARARQVPFDGARGQSYQHREPDVDRQLADPSTAFAPGVQRLLREQARDGRYKVDFSTMKVK